VGVGAGLGVQPRPRGVRATGSVVSHLTEVHIPRIGRDVVRDVHAVREVLLDALAKKNQALT